MGAIVHHPLAITMTSHRITSQTTAKFSVLSIESIDNETARSNKKFKHIFLDIDEPYTRTMIHQALLARGFATTLGPGHGMDAIELPCECDFQWSEYERIDWQRLRVCASSFRIRKGLSRKAQLALYLNRHVAKNPTSVLKRAIPETVILDTWAVWDGSGSGGGGHGLADMVMGSGSSSSSTSNINQRQILEQCLEAAKKLMESNGDATWILKGSTVNKGVGIYIVHVYEQVLDLLWSESDIREW